MVWRASFLLLVVASVLEPQPTRGDVIVCGAGAQPTVIRYDRSGPGVTAQPALLSSTLVGRIPGNTLAQPIVRSVAVDHDNQNAVGVVYDVPTSWIVRFDPRTGAVLATLTQFPTPSSSVFFPYDVERDQDGGYVLLGVKDHLWKVDAAGTVLSTLDLKAALPGFPAAYDYRVDHEDGTAILFYATNLYRVNRVTGTVVSVYGAPIDHGTSYQVSQDHRTGWLVWGTGDGTRPAGCRGVMRVDTRASPPRPTTLLGAPNCPIPNFLTAYASRLDRQSAPNPRLLFGGDGAWSGFGSIDLRAGSVQIHHFLNGIFSALGLDVIGSVNLTSRSLGPRRWQLDLSFPGLGGQGYRLAPGLSGTHPGVPIDTRTANLRPDALTLLALQGPLPPFLVGTRGVLDGAGRATATLDLTPLGGALDGRPIHFLAVALDPAAPSGIAAISDPYVIVSGARY